MVVPQNGWFTMENPIKMDDLGGKPTIFGKTHILVVFDDSTLTPPQPAFKNQLLSWGSHNLDGVFFLLWKAYDQTQVLVIFPDVTTKKSRKIGPTIKGTTGIPIISEKT